MWEPFGRHSGPATSDERKQPLPAAHALGVIRWAGVLAQTASRRLRARPDEPTRSHPRCACTNESPSFGNHVVPSSPERRRTLNPEVRGSILYRVEFAGGAIPSGGRPADPQGYPATPGSPKYLPWRYRVRHLAASPQPIRRWTCGSRSRPEGSPTEEQRIGFRRNSYSPRGNSPAVIVCAPLPAP